MLWDQVTGTTTILKPAYLPELFPMFNWTITAPTLILMDILGCGIDIYFIIANEKGYF